MVAQPLRRWCSRPRWRSNPRPTRAQAARRAARVVDLNVAIGVVAVDAVVATAARAKAAAGVASHAPRARDATDVHHAMVHAAGAMASAAKP